MWKKNKKLKPFQLFRESERVGAKKKISNVNVCVPTIPNQCVQIDSAVTPRISWGLSFPPEALMRTHPQDSSLEYERGNNGAKVSWMAFIQSFLDWDILDCHFPSRLPRPCWRFEASCDCLPVSEAIPAPFLPPSPPPNQSWTVRGGAVQVHGGWENRGRVWIYIYIWIPSTC